MQKQIIIGHIFTLSLGCFIYISFRQDTLLMFNWFDKINVSEVISDYRFFTLPLAEKLPTWFLYSLPDGLWLFSFCSVLLAVWNNTISKHNIYWLLSVPTIGIVSEIGQLAGIVTGTFDIFYLTFYLGGIVLPILIFTNLITFKTDE